MTSVDSIAERGAPESFQVEDVAECERLGRAFVELGRDGCAHLEGFLSTEWCEALADEIRRTELTKRPEQFQWAEQRLLSRTVSAPFDGYPSTAAIAEMLRKNVRELMPDVEGAESYGPTEANFHEYPPGEIGITPHRDEADSRFMVAVLTVEGAADFLVYEDHQIPRHDLGTVIEMRQSAPVIEQWSLTAGSLILLRAPGFDGNADGRPMHEVSGSTDGSSRLSVVFRMYKKDQANG